MKNGKKPTRQQMKAMRGVGLAPENWLVYKVDSKQNALHITHRNTGSIKIIPA